MFGAVEQEELAAARQAVIRAPTGNVCGQSGFCIAEKRSCVQVIWQQGSK